MRFFQFDPPPPDDDPTKTALEQREHVLTVRDDILRIEVAALARRVNDAST